MAVLHVLRDSPALTPAELAQRLDLARPTISNLLRDLEAAGYLRREPSESDRRSIIVTLTDRSREVQDAFRRGRVEVVSAAWAGLDADDRAALLAATPALRRLAALLLHETTLRSPSRRSTPHRPPYEARS